MSDTAAQIRRLFATGDALTVGEVAQRLGLPAPRVRRHIKAPYYRRVACEWATRRWEYRWRLVTEPIPPCRCSPWNR